MLRFHFLAQIACVLYLLFRCEAKVLLEVEFDIAPQSDQQQQQTPVAQVLTSFLQDENLNWLRYLNTLVDGTPYKTPSRVAFLEFNDVQAWTAFETNQKGAIHVLFDIYWTPWRRLPWTSIDTDPVAEVKPIEPDATRGYVYSFKYSVKKASKSNYDSLISRRLGDFVAGLSKHEGFLERTRFEDPLTQSTFDHLVIYEFTSLAALSEAVYGNSIFELSADARSHYDKYAATIFQPANDQKGTINYGADIRASNSDE